MTNPATEAFERLFAELARKYDQTMDPGDLMQILSLINSRFSALELRFELNQSSAAAERDPRLRIGERAWWEIGRDGETVTMFEKLKQSMEFGSVMERVAIENNKLYQELRASALGQPSAAAEPDQLEVAARRAEKLLTSMGRLSGVECEARDALRIALARRESQPVPAAGQAEPCAHEWRIGGYTFAPPMKEPKTVYLYCTWCDISRRFSWVPAQAEGNEPR